MIIAIATRCNGNGAFGDTCHSTTPEPKTPPNPPRASVGREREEERRFRVHINTHGQCSAGGKPLWGGPCRKVDIEEVYVRPTGGKGSENDPEDPDA